MIYPIFFPPDKDEPAEKLVYNMLKSLDPKRYDIFYHQQFVRRNKDEAAEYEIDFIIADLGGGKFNGLLVLEVKGGVIKYSGQTRRWTQNGVNIQTSKEPVKQAQSNMYNLIHRYPDVSSRVPFGWAVCFPDPRNIYSSKQLPGFLNIVQLVESSALHAIHKQLPLIFKSIREQNPHLRGTELSGYFSFRDELLAGLGVAVPLHSLMAADERQLIQLTKDQMNLLIVIENNSNVVVSGPAGCGKTVMATTIARKLREKGQKVLLLTFNRIPAANIRQGFRLTGDEADITIENYHRFVRQQIEKHEPGWFDEHVKQAGELFWTLELAMKLSEVLRKEDPYFDVLIIDEAQDFRPEWFESLNPALKPDGKLFLFMDEDQNIFSHYSGLPTGRHFTKIPLSHNCRNTQSIIELLEQYIEKKIPFPDATPEGQPVEFYTYKNDVEQVRILRDEWLRMVNEEEISPDRIVIILNTKLKDSCLKEVKSFGKWPLQEVSTDTGHISPNHVNVTRIRTFKGLEADMVFIADTDKLETQDKKVLYTQASRARLWLGVLEKG